MNVLHLKGGLTEAELDQLAGFLGKRKGAGAMNLEEMDGFFAALIAGPEMVPPSEFLPEVFGGKDAFESSELDEANAIFGLILRYWNKIAATLKRGEVHTPILLEDEDGAYLGSDWSRGFVRGMDMRSAGWAKLLADEEKSGFMLPVLMLYHEHDEDPQLRPGPIGPEKREELIVLMLAGVVRAYRYFRGNREPETGSNRSRRESSPGKIGRNDQCPCGSGRKYKRCCGVTVH